MNADYRLRFYDEQAAKIVAHLRSVADELEREAVPNSRPGVGGTSRYLAAAERVNHSLTWGIANLGAYRLFDVAFHADQAENEAAS